MSIKQLINYFKTKCECDVQIEIVTGTKTHYNIVYKKKDKKLIEKKLTEENLGYMEIIVKDLVYFEGKIEFWF